jgi:hypothetical protein
MEYKIICHAPSGRVVASLDMSGCLTVHHDNFNDEDGFDLRELVKAFDKWTHRRQIQHTSKKGLNEKTIKQLNAVQQKNPGKVLFPDSV